MKKLVIASVVLVILVLAITFSGSALAVPYDPGLT